jgi:hypothetical protein
LYPPEIPLALCLCALYARIPAVPKFVLAAIFALAGNYSFVQGNLIWLVTLPVILFALNILPANVRRNFAIALGGYRRGGPSPGISLVSNKTPLLRTTRTGRSAFLRR